jgi:2'-5' RNA ligase
MRTFIAIDLDTPIKHNLFALIRDLDTGERTVRWVKEQALHLTLKFCGDITPSMAESIKKALEETASRFQAFPLHVLGTGRFPPGSRRPRVLWVGIEENPILIALQKDVDLSLARLGFTKEQRPYFAHLTLGRVKSASGLDSILDKLDDYATHSFGTMTAGRLTFFQSTLKPTGAEHTVLHEVKLP